MYYTINIGRQFGSGGLAVANYLSEKLNIKAYDKELINLAAKDIGFNPQIFKKMDERPHRSLISGLFHSRLTLNDASHTSYNSGIITNDVLFEAQCKTIQCIADKESCIFIGRCADYVLRDKPNILNVFLVASLQSKIDRISERNNISPREAESLIYQIEKQRSAYYNYYTFKKWGHAASYDLCINTDRLGIEGTGDYIIDYVNKNFFQCE